MNYSIPKVSIDCSINASNSILVHGIASPFSFPPVYELELT